MAHAPPTRASLLIRIRDPHDGAAWREFIEIYSSLIYGFLRKRGLQDADAADLMQDVLRSVAGAAGRLEYDPRKGTFRSWLFTITRNKLNTFLSRRRRQATGTGDSAMQTMLAEEPAPEEDAWDEEYRRRLFEWASEKVRGSFGENVWQAFWQTAVESKNPKQVADDLGMSVGAVYVAKSRVLSQIREQIQQLESE